MQANNIEYKISSATENQIKVHLLECSENFIPSSKDSVVAIRTCSGKAA